MKTVGVCSPSNWIHPERFEKGLHVLRSLGVTVKVHNQVHERHYQSAGTHEQRRNALLALYQDPEVDIIMATSGGHRALHLMSMLDYETIKDNPKPLIGFSDTTALLNATYTKSGMLGMYGPPVASLADGLNPEDLGHLQTFLTQGTLTGHLTAERFKEGPCTMSKRIVGGNLCLFTNLMNTPYEPPLEESVLILEDDGEEIRNIDRMMLHLKNQGVFDKVSALVLGQFTQIKDTEHAGQPFARNLNSIFVEHLQNVPCAVYMHAPFGHGDRLYPLPIGEADIQLLPDGLSFKMAL